MKDPIFSLRQRIYQLISDNRSHHSPITSSALYASATVPHWPAMYRSTDKTPRNNRFQ